MLNLQTAPVEEAESVAAHQPRDGDKLARVIADDTRFLFEPRPLTRHEDPGDYDRLLVFIAQDVKPRDIIEWFWVKDIVDLAWEARRLRLFKVLLMEVNMRKAGGRLLYPVFELQTPD